MLYLRSALTPLSSYLSISLFRSFIQQLLFASRFFLCVFGFLSPHNFIIFHTIPISYRILSAQFVYWSLYLSLSFTLFNFFLTFFLSRCVVCLSMLIFFTYTPSKSVNRLGIVQITVKGKTTEPNPKKTNINALRSGQHYKNMFPYAYAYTHTHTHTSSHMDDTALS